MLCKSCGKKFKTSNNFCEFCGAPAPVFTPAESNEAAPLVQNDDLQLAESFARKAPSKSLKTLNLQAWAGWTWLVAKNYGSLTITETHLEYDIKKFWATNVWSIISKIFSWGFDWQTSIWVGKGSSDLRAVSNVRIYALDWLAWKAHTLVISTTGIPDVYFFSSKQLPEVEAFIETLKQETANAKFVTKVGK
jgi:hypothetical protein